MKWTYKQRKALDAWVSQGVPYLANGGFDLTVRVEDGDSLRVNIVGYDGQEPRIGVGSAEVVIAPDGAVTAWHGGAVTVAL